MSAASRTANPLHYWREALLVLVPLLGLLGILLLAPIPQDPRYHHFADNRILFGVPNFANVASNLLFLIVGTAGIALSLRGKPTGAWKCWAVFFAGVALVCFGSGYYHAAPSSAALVWDRLPMTLAFMALFVALLSEHTSPAVGRYLLLPALLAGIASIGWWHSTGDLRFYLWVQGAPLLIIPLALLLFPARYTHRFYLLYGLALYLLAKVAELYDQELYALTQATVSGHSLKHLFAALSALSVYLMLRRRHTLPRVRSRG